MSTCKLREYLEQSRTNANKDLVEKHPAIPELLQQIDKYLESLVAYTLNKVVADEKDKQRMPLTVSFIRTELIINDLLLNCENTEAAILLRKQIETFIRYEEIAQGQKFTKTPQLKYLKYSELKPIYGSLSEIAHNSKDSAYKLLGYEESTDDSTPTVVNLFCVYDELLIETIEYHCIVFKHFMEEMHLYQGHLDRTYSVENENGWLMNEFIPVGKKTSLKCFNAPNGVFYK